MAVEPPTLPAVCTRIIGLPRGAERVGEEQLGLHHALEEVGRLADHERVDVGPVRSASSSARLRGLAHEAGDRDVVAAPSCAWSGRCR